MGLMDIRCTIAEAAYGSAQTTLSYKSLGAAGADLCSTEDGELAPGEYRAFPTGVCIELPPHIEGQVRPRSGLAVHHGVTVLNSPGTVDSDYRGEIMVILINHGKEPFVVNKGDRIAQLVLSPVVHGTFHPVAELSRSDRGVARFGSTGV